MFGSARTVNGCPRLFPVNDYTLKSEIIKIVHAKDDRRAPLRFSDRDLRFVDPSSLLALNVAGRQGHLFLTTYGGRAITFLVHAAAGDVDVVPLRFSQARHDPGVLLRCTFTPKDRLLVLNDICDDRPIAERINDLHVLVHTDHTPDPFLFPLRVVARKYFTLAQAPDLKKLVHSAPLFRTHSVSVIDTKANAPQRYIEKRIFADVDGTAPRSSGGRTRIVPDQCTTVALISRDSEPDSYRMSVDKGATWDYLCVKTIAESAHLAKVFADNSMATLSCAVVSDGGKWRFLGVCA
jgi:hypothetical protein